MTLRRHNPDVHDEAFAAFVDDVRAAVPSSPREETAERHLAAMRAAAEESGSQQDHAGAHASGAGVRDRAGRRRSTGPLRPVLRLGAVTAGTIVAFSGVSTGLAAVGVELPDPVRAPFDAVGIELPNQAEDAERTAPPSEDERRDGTRPRDERDRDRGRSGERRGGDERRSGDQQRRGRGRAHGRNGTQPGKDGTRGRSGQNRRDDTAPNNGEAPRRGSGASPGNGRGSSSPGGGNGSAPGGGNRSAAPRPKPDRARPTGPKPRVGPRRAPKARTTPKPAPAPAPEAGVAPEPAPATTTSTTTTTP